MAQTILIPNVQSINPDLLDSQLKAAAPVDCYGLTLDKDGLHIVVSDTILPNLLATLQNLCLTHNSSQQTATQQADATGKTDTASLLSAADTALAQLASKLATFQGTPTLGNAGPLLVEAVQDLQATIKALKYIARKVS